MGLVGSAVSGAGTILGGFGRASADEANAQGALYAGQTGQQGAYFKAAAQEQGGLFAQQEAEFQALQLDQAAGDARAEAQRAAMEERHNAKLALSTLVARAASSGGGTGGTVEKLASNIAERGEYQALLDVYTGENRARGLEDQATGARVSGAAAKYGADVEALASRYAGDTGLTAARLKAGAYSGAAFPDELGGFLGGAGSILSGVGSAYGNYAIRKIEATNRAPTPNPYG
jgi:hypothetical protein